MRIVLIVPTKDRPKDISNLFESIKKQIRMPDLVIVVDGSDNPIETIINKFKDFVNVEYYTCRPPSLPKQRNLGISKLPSDTDWLGFLDDDLVLEPDAIQNLEKFIIEQGTKNLKGVGLSIINQPSPKESFFSKIFLMSSKFPGKMTMAGYPTAIPFAKNNLKTEWLYGGATFWSADIYEKYKYDEWFAGTGYLEDVDFSYQISREYELVILSSAKCYHYDHGVTLAKENKRAEWQVIAWWYFVKKYKDFNLILVSWAIFGLVLKNLILILITRQNKYVQRIKGNFLAIKKIFQGTALEYNGFSK